MGHSAHKLTVLDNRAAAHTAHDPSRHGKEAGVCDFYGEGLGALTLIADITDRNLIRVNLVAVNGAKDRGAALAPGAEPYGHRFSFSVTVYQILF